MIWTIQQNGVDDCNCTLTDHARSMLSAVGLEKKFSAEAVNTAMYLMNRSTTIALGHKTSEGYGQANL